MIYHRVTATSLGGPEVLQVTEHELAAPAKGQVRIRVLAASVSRPDLTVRSGKALYSGTPLGYKPPFTPGYAVLGDVEAAGEGVSSALIGNRVGVLCVVGGYSEVLYWRADRLIPVPAALEPGAAVTLLLNYLVAYQVLHRSAKVQPGSTALVVGASGGIGTALLQLGRLAGLTLYGMASGSKHAAVCELGATPIDYRTQDFAAIIRCAEPQGLDAVIDGMNQLDTLRKSLALLRPGGCLVSYGEPASRRELLQILGLLLRINLLPNSKQFKLYGTSTYFLFDRRPYEEDWRTLFGLLAGGKIQPVIAARFPILAAAKAHALLEGGSVIGNVVLVTPELLQG
jgi:NADPH:quinone reductase-like Zn-dependent oxidoreductase